MAEQVEKTVVGRAVLPTRPFPLNSGRLTARASLCREAKLEAELGRVRERGAVRGGE